MSICLKNLFQTHVLLMKFQYTVNSFAVKFTDFVISKSWCCLTVKFINVWSNMSINLIDEIEIVKAMKLKRAMTCQNHV